MNTQAEAVLTLVRGEYQKVSWGNPTNLVQPFWPSLEPTQEVYWIKGTIGTNYPQYILPDYLEQYTRSWEKEGVTVQIENLDLYGEMEER